MCGFPSGPKANELAALSRGPVGTPLITVTLRMSLSPSNHRYRSWEASGIRYVSPTRTGFPGRVRLAAEQHRCCGGGKLAEGTGSKRVSNHPFAKFHLRRNALVPLTATPLASEYASAP